MKTSQQRTHARTRARTHARAHARTQRSRPDQGGHTCVHSLGFGPRVNRLGSGLLTSSMPGLPGIVSSLSSYREIHALASAKRQQRWHHAECTSSLQRATCDRRRATRPGQHTTYNGRQHGRCTRHGRRANLQRPDHSVHHATAQHAQCDSERRTTLATLVLLVGHSVLTGYSRTKRR